MRVLQTFLEEGENSIGVKVDDQVGTASKDAESGLAREDVGVVCHSEYLGLESGPGMAAFHGIIEEVGDGIDRLSSDNCGRFMEEGVEEDSLESRDGLSPEVVVESDALVCGGTEEETAEEDEGEGAHLGGR